MQITDTSITPQIGEGATVRVGSDCYPYTIIDVSDSGKTIYLQEDRVERTDNNGMSENQEYNYFRNPEGAEVKATKRKNGSWKLTGSNSLVTIGIRRKFYDFSF